MTIKHAPAYKAEFFIRSYPAAAVLAVLSGLMFGLSMPGASVGWLAWLAFVPLLLAVQGRSGMPQYMLFNLTGLIGSILTHSWFPDVLGQGLGLFLMVMTGFLYGGFLQWGHALEQRVRSPLRVFVLPVVWTALEWLRFVLPVTRDWWIEVLAKSQWLYPSALQTLSVTGFAGLSFLIMLANAAFAALLLRWRGERRIDKSAALALLVPIAAVVWGAVFLAAAPRGQAVEAAATVDMANQDPAIQRLGGGTSAGDGYLADTPAMSQAIFDVNARLTRQAAAAKPAFIVWGENEFASADDEAMMSRLRELARETGAYITADVTWDAEDGLHDTALLVGPDGREIGRTAKINLTDGEKAYGFVPGTRRGQVYETAHGLVGLAICWDRHTTGIIRSLADSGAGLVLVPVDDDFHGNGVFPKYAASDTVFRAAENRVAIVAGTTSGVSQIITPYGEMTARSGINERGYIAGTTYLGGGKGTLYTRFGDWFGLLAAAILGAILLRNLVLCPAKRN